MQQRYVFPFYNPVSDYFILYSNCGPGGTENVFIVLDVPHRNGNTITTTTATDTKMTKAPAVVR